jgi:hypothetical protein
MKFKVFQAGQDKPVEIEATEVSHRGDGSISLIDENGGDVATFAAGHWSHFTVDRPKSKKE